MDITSEIIPPDIVEAELFLGLLEEELDGFDVDEVDEREEESDEPESEPEEPEEPEPELELVEAVFPLQQYLSKHFLHSSDCSSPSLSWDLLMIAQPTQVAQFLSSVKFELVETSNPFRIKLIFSSWSYDIL